ncbi:MAG: hypothetical protein HY561_10860 [Gemmatimonadetes bacterium]|nr:hypothetical protein [Gemmatimonadota bacterium]
MRSLLPALLAFAGLARGVPAQTLADYDYENLSFRGIGFDWGWLWPSKVEPTSAYSLRLDLGYLGPGVRIAPSITYWSSRMRERELKRLAERLRPLGATVTADQLAPIDWSDLALQLDAHYVWTTPVRLLPYVGGGLGVHTLNGQGKAIQDTFVEDLLDAITAGVVVLAGLEYAPLDRFRLYGEARYTLLADVHYGGVRIGGAIMLLPRAGAGEAR